MKAHIADLLLTAIETLKAEGTLPESVTSPPIRLSETKNKAHGDLACNVAMMLAKPARKPPRDIAAALVRALPPDPLIRQVEIAGPGFMNFFVSQSAHANVLPQAIAAGKHWGRQSSIDPQRVQIEFVSANPTGPLHVGHGRGAAYGATLANLLRAVGHQVHSEYYVNDAGRQMHILAVSVWIRYLQAGGLDCPFPLNGYKGDYIKAIAEALRQRQGDALVVAPEALFSGLPEDTETTMEPYIDSLIERAQSLLGTDRYQQCFKAGLDGILADIREDLEAFGVTFNEWFSEQSLADSGKVEAAIEKLHQAGHLYEKSGALWFRSTEFGDDKDRVVRRENGQTTYFASDIAYHMNKFDRGFDRVINIWGADHHGYIARVKASLQAMGYDQDKLDIALVQFANLWRHGKKVAMSTRSGSFVTLRELREEIGNDAARFYYVLMRSDQHMDFDLDLAVSQSRDNPLYYIQYAHARICALMNKAAEAGMAWRSGAPNDGLEQLTLQSEVDLMKAVTRYPEVVQAAAQNLEPHSLIHFLKDLAAQYHGYYAAEKMLVDDAVLRQARLTLSEAVRVCIYNGLSLLGVSSPQSM